MVSIGKVHFSAKCPFGRIGELNFFWEKKTWMPDSKIFTFFMPKNDLFFDFGTPLFSGRRPDFLAFWYFFCTYAKKYNLVPPLGDQVRLDFCRNCNCDSTLSKILEILGILAWFFFFLTMVFIGKCLLVQSAFSAAWVGWKFFEKKKYGCWIRNFSHFLFQKTTFFRFGDPPCFRAGGPNFFFSILAFW